MDFENPEDFINHSSIGIHIVSPEGIIEFANACELEMLGYEESEYVGHHVSEFQMDEPVLCDMLERLGEFESLKNYPSRVRGKEGIKYVLYNSSVYEKDDEFIHTRCYGTDIEPEVYETMKKYSPYFK